MQMLLTARKRALIRLQTNQKVALGDSFSKVGSTSDDITQISALSTLDGRI